MTLATAVFAAAASAADRPQGAAKATCGHQSSAGFPRSSADLRVGPLALVGARTPQAPAAVARFGGMKYPAVVRAGHRVVVQIAGAAARRTTSMDYADATHAEGGRTVADGVRDVD